MTFYAHTKNRDGAACSEEEWQPLCEHLNNVAAMVKAFALKKFESCAYLEGLLHDVGKYQISFQERLRGSSRSVDHAVCGAREVAELLSYKKIVAMAIERRKTAPRRRVKKVKKICR